MKEKKTIEQMDFYLGKNKDKKKEAIIDVDKFFESVQVMNTAKNNEAIIDSEKLKKWFGENYGEYDNHYIAKNCLIDTEIKSFDQAILEIHKERYKPVKEFLPAPVIESKEPINGDITNESAQLSKENYFLVSSFAKALQQKNRLTKNDFSFFYDFLDDLFIKKKDIEFQKYLLTKSEKDFFFQRTTLIPYRYLYKKNLKIQCMLDSANKNVYIIGFQSLHPFRSEVFLKQILNERADINPLYINSLFFSLEIDSKGAADILGWPIFDVIEHLDKRKIYSRNPNGEQLRVSANDPRLILLPEDDPRLIPLSELYAFMEKSKIKTKQERIDRIIEYMDRTSKAIVGQLEESKMPHPLDYNKDYLFYKNEYSRLKRKNPTPEERDHYISVIIPIITEIVKIVESKKFQSGKNNLIDKTEFFNAIRGIDNEYPIQGEIIGNTMFEALSDNYRHKKKGRQIKSVNWLKELKQNL